MKIFTIELSHTPLQARLSVDSSLVLRGNPWFLPYDGGWQASLFLAVRISRLGMNIAQKFAPRYYNAICLMAHPHECADAETHFEWTRDGALIKGNDMEQLPEDNVTVSVSVENNNGDNNAAPRTNVQSPVDIIATDFYKEINKAIEAISAYHTLKTGDLIALQINAEPLKLIENVDYKLSINNTHALTVKVR